ncbi:MAG: nucleoside phosphorylase [Vicinamibacterales bacterium]
MDRHIPRASFYSDGDPHVDPERLVAHLCAMRGITREQLGVRRTVLGTFSSRLTEFLAASSGAVQAEHWLRRAEREAYLAGDNVMIATFPIGAPAAVTLMEEMIACGMTSLIVTGAAGSLQPHAPIGSLVVPNAAIREEGTSHHYAPSDDEAVPSPRLQEAIERALRERGVAYTTGASWTTDAVYREHRGKIDRYRAAGVVTVEMELSALFTIAAFRGIDCAALLVVSDELHGDAWDLGFGGETFERAMGQAAMIALDVARTL